jgi:hypothetical protein
VRGSRPGLGFGNKNTHRKKNKEQYAFKGVATGRKFHRPMEKWTNREPAHTRMGRDAKGRTVRNEQKGSSPRAKERASAGSLRKRREQVRASEPGSTKGRLEGPDSRTPRRQTSSKVRVGRGDRRGKGKGMQMLPRDANRPKSVSSGANRTGRRRVPSLPQGTSVSGGTPLSSPKPAVERYGGKRAGQRGKQKSWEAGKPPRRGKEQPTRNWGTASDTKSWRSPYNAEKSRHGRGPSRSPSRSFSRRNE